MSSETVHPERHMHLYVSSPSLTFPHSLTPSLPPSKAKKGRAGIGGGKGGILMGGGLLGCRKGGEGLIITPSVLDASTKEASFKGGGGGMEEGEHVREVLFPVVFDWKRKEGGKEAAPFALPLDVCIETITSLLDRLLVASARPLLVETLGGQDGEKEKKEGREEEKKFLELSPKAFLTPEMLLRKHKEAAWEVVVACVAALVVKDDDGAEGGKEGGKEKGGGVLRHR